MNVRAVLSNKGLDYNATKYYVTLRCRNYMWDQFDAFDIFNRQFREL